jgi:hypothetical protein
MKSPFIENSKDPELSPMVESHIMGGVAPSSGILSQSEPKGGTPAWNSRAASAKESFAGEDGLQNLANNSKLGPSIFNAPGQKIARDTGVNYKPAINAGNRLTEDPFQLADGFPGD